MGQGAQVSEDHHPGNFVDVTPSEYQSHAARADSCSIEPQNGGRANRNPLASISTITARLTAAGKSTT